MGGHLKTKGKYTIPGNIRGHKFTIGLDVVDSDIPLLLSRSEMRNLDVKLNLATEEVEILCTTSPLLTTSEGLPAIQLHPGRGDQKREEIKRRGDQKGEEIRKERRS